MTKFNVGDAAKFVPAWEGQTDKMSTPLDLYYTQTISEVDEDSDCIKVLGDPDWWHDGYWEIAVQLQKHQVAKEINLTYKDCNSITQRLDKFHLHELLDRTDCVRRMIKELLQNHPASHLVSADLEAAQEVLGKAYQRIGEISFDEFGEDK